MPPVSAGDLPEEDTHAWVTVKICNNWWGRGMDQLPSC